MTPSCNSQQKHVIAPLFILDPILQRQRNLHNSISSQIILFTSKSTSLYTKHNYNKEMANGYVIT